MEKGKGEKNLMISPFWIYIVSKLCVDSLQKSPFFRFIFWIHPSMFVSKLCQFFWTFLLKFVNLKLIKDWIRPILKVIFLTAHRTSHDSPHVNQHDWPKGGNRRWANDEWVNKSVRWEQSGSTPSVRIHIAAFGVFQKVYRPLKNLSF